MQSKKNILVVDDEPVCLKIMTEILQSRGYDVKEAGSGAEALDALQKFDPDLIMIDVRMPEMNGFDLLDNIKKLPKVAAKPVVFVTGIDDFHARKVAKELGAVDYVVKPIDDKEMDSVLEKYLLR